MTQDCPEVRNSSCRSQLDQTIRPSLLPLSTKARHRRRNRQLLQIVIDYRHRMADANKAMNLIRNQVKTNTTKLDDSFSLLALTPLPDFTVHENDDESDKIDWLHPDIVNPKPKPYRNEKPLMEKALVTAITDAEPATPKYSCQFYLLRLRTHRW